MKNKFIPNHLHLLVRGYIQNPPKDEFSLNIFLKKLVYRVRMKVVGGPTSVYVDEFGNRGVTGTITLSTSHASVHIWDEEIPSLFQFDLYSCTEFTAEEVINFINESFNISEGSYIFIDRNNKDFKIIKSGNI